MAQYDALVDSAQQFDKTKLYELRQSFGWTRTQFANAVGVSAATIEAWESGSRSVSLDVERMSSQEIMDCLSSNNDKNDKIISGKFSFQGARKFLGQKVEELSKKIGISVSAIRSYEKGARSPSPETITRFEKLITERLKELNHDI